MAVRRKMFRAQDEDRQNRLILQAGLPVRLRRSSFKPMRVIKAMQLDKKKKDGKLRFILPVRIGQVKAVEDVSLAEVRKILLEMGGNR